MIGNINLETLERLKKYADEKSKWYRKYLDGKYTNSTYWKSGFKQGYAEAMKEISHIIGQTIANEIEYQTQTLNAMYNDEFGEDRK